MRFLYRNIRYDVEKYVKLLWNFRKLMGYVSGQKLFKYVEFIVRDVFLVVIE